ncbi:ester cyclase [Photobacterium makurazakiensis]|uniref:ester cyclase n=1 Tax=Photobacterium makurazakiensis TaxID=2910234 RepID=UPI003D11E5CC
MNRIHFGSVIHIAGAPAPSLSVEEFKGLVSGLLTAFPDLKLTVEDQIVAGNQVATRWSAKGTHSGMLGDNEPTGNQAQFDGLILDTVVDGQVVKWLSVGSSGIKWGCSSS